MNKIFTKIPHSPGVYYFFNKNKDLIYIGKATSLKSRVRSYFHGQKTFRPIEELIEQVHDIKWQTADSVLEAIILEALEIKKHQPKYNVIGKDDKSWNYLVLTKEDYPQLQTIRMHDWQQLSVAEQKKRFAKAFGPFPQLRTTEILKILRRLFHYSTCKPNIGRPCLYYQMRQCDGVCTGEISSLEYQRRIIKPLTLFLSGRKKQVISDLNKLMKEKSKNNFFEEAGQLRDQINNLKKIHDLSLIDKSFFDNVGSGLLALLRGRSGSKTTKMIRIEGYDISNLGTTNIVGSMVVFDQNGPIKKDYRKFKVRNFNKPSDVDALAQVVERRLKHLEWPLPDYFLIDGGKPQINKIIALLKEKNVDRPVIGIAKGIKRKKNEFHVSTRTIQHFIEKNKTLLIQVRDEAHRFAINYQKQTRKIKKD